MSMSVLLWLSSVIYMKKNIKWGWKPSNPEENTLPWSLSMKPNQNIFWWGWVKKGHGFDNTLTILKLPFSKILFFLIYTYISVLSTSNFH